MLVGLLLMRMPPEDAFWTLAAILETYIPDYHSVNLYQLRVDAAAFEICLKRYSSGLYKHMVIESGINMIDRIDTPYLYDPMVPYRLYHGPSMACSITGMGYVSS